MEYTVLITGANRGLGLEFTKQYAKDKWHVLACCRQPNQANELQTLTQQFHNVQILQLNICNEAEISQVATSLVDTPIDLLINNAGIYGGDHQSLNTVTSTTLAETFNTNTISPLLISRALFPSLMQGKLKTIATLTSLMGSISNNTGGDAYAYRASKAALNMLMKSLSHDYQNHGIRVLLLHPGWVQTDMGGNSAPLDATTSVTGLRKVIAEIKPSTQHLFYNYQANELPW